MKNLKSILVLALVVFFASCSADSLIGKLEKAAEKGKVKKAIRIEKKLDKKGALTKEQKEKIDKAEDKLESKITDAEWTEFCIETAACDWNK